MSYTNKIGLIVYIMVVGAWTNILGIEKPWYVWILMMLIMGVSILMFLYSDGELEKKCRLLLKPILGEARASAFLEKFGTLDQFATVSAFLAAF